MCVHEVLEREMCCTSVMSLEAAAALMCRLGCRTELLQSRARANVPTDLKGRGVGKFDKEKKRGKRVSAKQTECKICSLKTKIF